MEDLKFSKEKKGDVLIVRIEGKLDIDAAPFFNKQIKAEIDRGVKHFVINLDELLHLSSAGLGALININGLLEKVNGAIKISANENYMINKIFELHGISHIFEVFDNEDEAVESFKTQ